MQQGIYEEIISQLIQKKILDLDNQRFYIGTKTLDSEEAAIYLSRYLNKVIYFAINNLKAEKRLDVGITLVNDIIRLVRDRFKLGEQDLNLLDVQGKLLTAIIDKTTCSYPDVAEYLKAITPYTRLTQSELFTGSNQSISLESEMKREIASSDEVCILVSFIKWTGLRGLQDDFLQFTESGKKLRVITTSYIGATDLKAVQFLAGLKNTEVKISYNNSNERLHAKAYLFLRKTGFDTGYIGSSNISHSALNRGLEWNIKITQAEIGHVIDKFHKTFETYWESSEFETFQLGVDDEKLSRSLKQQKFGKSLDLTELRKCEPFWYQKEILDKLLIERNVHNRWKNLIVAATGTGKTMISAFDYRRFKNENSHARLLYVAHRKEILQQAQKTFKDVLQDYNFGQLWVDGLEPDNYDFLFASNMTLKNRVNDLPLADDYYDYIIIDEVHHVSASSYRPILNRFKPKILVGLTATPERMDGEDILPDFCNAIAAEIRLPEALNQRLLCPFQYFGVSDNIDLSRVSWENGKYNVAELTCVYTESDERVRLIINALDRYLTDIHSVRALCFCASIDHAKYMAMKFSLVGLKADVLLGDTHDRTGIRKQLERKEINYLFVVDVFNEGVDIPSVDTVLFLRPTESLTVFLQQLGRGLRLHENKQCLTVLDFVGNARAEYNFESRFRAMIGRSNMSIKEEIEEGFVHLPLGCTIVLEKQAQSHILNNIKSYVSFNKNMILARIRNFKNETNLPLTLSNFLKITHIPFRRIYNWDNKSWVTLCMDAGVLDLQELLFMKELSRAVRKKWLSADSYSYFSFLHELAVKRFLVKEEELSTEETLMATMFYYDMWQDAGTFNSLQEMFDALADVPLLIDEMIDIFTLLCDSVQALEIPLLIDFPCPLRVHGRYTREQIQVALGKSTLTKKSSGREGVERNKEFNVEAMFVDLNKTERDYSPTTMYNDYALSETLFHWQSQNSANEESSVGTAYISEQNRMLLFVREQKKDEYNNTMGYIFLGEVTYVSHYGNRPMNIRWKLKTPMPALLWDFAGKLAVG
mgnify:CR=1 FL=1